MNQERQIGNLEIDFIADKTIYVIAVHIKKEFSGNKHSLLVFKALFQYADDISSTVIWKADPINDRYQYIKDDLEFNESILFEYYTLKHKLAKFYQDNLEHDEMIPDGEMIFIRNQFFEKGEIGFSRKPRPAITIGVNMGFITDNF